MIASLSVIRTLRSITDVEVVGKWPNDVLLNGRKVSGVLVESLSSPSVSAIILRIINGCNF